MGYTGTAIKGFSWLTAFRVITRSFSLVKTVIVARFLSPSQFGLFGITTLVLAFIEVITETGVNVVLVQETEDINQYLGTAWLVSIIRGMLIALVMVVSAPFIAAFFKAPESTALIIAMSLVPLMRGFINPAVVKLQKELLFQREFFYRTINLVVEIGVTVVLLLLYPSPMSLVIGILAGVVSELVLSFVIVSPRPSLTYHKAYFAKLIRHGKWITAGVVLNYGFERGDNIIVGRLLGATSLGIYDMAYRFSMLPITEVADMMVRVVFPVFVKISGDYERLKRAYFRTIVVTTLLVAPFGVIVFFFPREIVHYVLGDKWLPAVDVLRVLAFLGVVRAISNGFSSLLLALQKQKQMAVATCVGLAGMLIPIIPMVEKYGIVGAAYSAFFGFVISIPITLYYSYKTLIAQKHSAANDTE
jgi:O-antigen/teichoic acid export membrane protein